MKHEGKSPFLYIEIPASEGIDSDKTTVMYGHFDKQPHFDGWKEGLHPTEPVIIEDKMYGRGCSDDGYSIYASLLALKAV